MKKLLFCFTILFCTSLFAQNEIKITSKKCIPRNGFHLKLKSVFDDSRCPEGVTCIWAGEVSVTIEVYKDKKFVEEKTVTINSKNRVENIKWFQSIYTQKIKEIQVLPYPKEGVNVVAKNQFIKIIFTD